MSPTGEVGAAPYAGRRAALATMHGKDRALARPLRAGLGLSLVVPDAFDTDAFGAFTGEVERRGTPRETCLRKARAGMAAAGLPLGLASEGTFGPHPVLGFAPLHEEVLALVDDERGMTLVETLATMRTNFAHTTTDGPLPEGFLRRAGFPAHALAVRPNRDGTAMRKGVADRAALADAIEEAAAGSSDGLARLETDMRAHANPYRLRVLRRLAGVLVRRLRTPCPACGGPGWGVEGREPGLPCGACGTPTALPWRERWRCPGCGHEASLPRADGVREADPMVCGVCNP